jgi:hypothetical protein
MHIHKYLNAGCRHNIHNTKEFILSVVSEEFEDTKGIIRRTDNTMATRKRTKGQTTIYKTYHIKLKIVGTEQFETI